MPSRDQSRLGSDTFSHFDLLVDFLLFFMVRRSFAPKNANTKTSKHNRRGGIGTNHNRTPYCRATSRQRRNGRWVHKGPPIGKAGALAVLPVARLSVLSRFTRGLLPLGRFFEAPRYSDRRP